MIRMGDKSVDKIDENKNCLKIHPTYPKNVPSVHSPTRQENERIVGCGRRGSGGRIRRILP